MVPRRFYLPCSIVGHSFETGTWPKEQFVQSCTKLQTSVCLRTYKSQLANYKVKKQTFSLFLTLQNLDRSISCLLLSPYDQWFSGQRSLQYNWACLSSGFSYCDDCTILLNVEEEDLVCRLLRSVCFRFAWSWGFLILMIYLSFYVVIMLFNQLIKGFK